MTLGQNLMLLIGLLIALGFGALLSLGVWTGWKMWITERRRRASWEKHCEDRLAPDGRPYPPTMPGFCQSCGKSDAKIYHPDSGQEFCPACYDNSCRRNPSEPQSA